MHNSMDLKSPRLFQLVRALDEGHTSALEEFWKEIEEHGEPLFEPINGNKENILATLLWRAEEDLENVVIYSKLFSDGLADRERGKMNHLRDTNVWYRSIEIKPDSRITYFFTPNDSLESPGQMENPLDYFNAGRLSPLNPKAQVYLSGSDELITKIFFPEGGETNFAWYRSILEGPDAPPQPHIDVRSNVPKGVLTNLKISSSLFGHERYIGVYTPPGFRSDRGPYPLLICFDGMAYINHAFIPTPTILDNLLSENAIPPMMALFVDHLIEGEDKRMAELICSHEFNRFLVEELLPQVRLHYPITSDPVQTIVAGASAGGLGAAFAALDFPDVFGNVIAQTGAFRIGGQGRPENWIIRQFVESELLPIKFYLDVGLYENKGNGTSSLRTVRHMRDVLEAKGYQLQYAEHSGGHDYVVWRQTLADGLTYLIGL